MEKNIRIDIAPEYGNMEMYVAISRYFWRFNIGAAIEMSIIINKRFNLRIYIERFKDEKVRQNLAKDISLQIRIFHARRWVFPSTKKLNKSNNEIFSPLFVNIRDLLALY